VKAFGTNIRAPFLSLTNRCPNIAFISVFVLELLGFGLGYFDRFQVVRKFDFLIEDLLLRVIATEIFGFCNTSA
jgi:hypothetical protein